MEETLISKINKAINNGNKITVGTSFGADASCCYSMRFIPDDLDTSNDAITIFDGGDFVSICTNENETQIEYDNDNNCFYIDGNGWSTIVEF